MNGGGGGKGGWRCGGVFSWLLLGNILHCVYCGLVVGIQPLNCQTFENVCSPSDVNQDLALNGFPIKDNLLLGPN